MTQRKTGPIALWTSLAGMASLFALVGVSSIPTARADDPPVRIVSPDSGFTSDGSLEVKVWIAKGFYDQVLSKTAASEATLRVSVDGGGAPMEFALSNYGRVEPIALNPNSKSVQGYYWYANMNLSGYQCKSQITRVNHCDGCGRVKQTCGDEGIACRTRDVKVELFATNRAGNSVCDGNVCSSVSGVLPPAGPAVKENYVPANFWSLSNGVMSCAARANLGAKGNSCKELPAPAGKSCGN